MLRVAIAGVMHETNTFAPGRTELDDFRKEWVHGREQFLNAYTGTRKHLI